MIYEFYGVLFRHLKIYMKHLLHWSTDNGYSKRVQVLNYIIGPAKVINDVC